MGRSFQFPLLGGRGGGGGVIFPAIRCIISPFVCGIGRGGAGGGGGTLCPRVSVDCGLFIWCLFFVHYAPSDGGREYENAKNQKQEA